MILCSQVTGNRPFPSLRLLTPGGPLCKVDLLLQYIPPIQSFSLAPPAAQYDFRPSLLGLERTGTIMLPVHCTIPLRAPTSILAQESH